MEVQEYLQRVREEEALLPDVVVAETRDAGVENDSKAPCQFERLRKIAAEAGETDSGFNIMDHELQFFQAMKEEVSSAMLHCETQDTCALLRHCAQFLGTEGNGRRERVLLQNVEDERWVELFRSPPPDAMATSVSGISFATVSELLHRLANFLCEGRGKNIDESSSKWLFSLLLLLDDLHAVQESVSYELQRIKRALGRHVPIAMENLPTCDPDAEEDLANRERGELAISGYILNICIIQQHFKQR
ncbi:uncharacterized protein BcabD6B2_27390 [Babesia caballi]|uniref:Uncharacterized protein n=1 Tax=Babesia caballi TaxID=5871 RepID=A0AAV4LU32_BABCB|nr:hypothetical protein, conserved [Babesia caballi]